jgi:hypothetical protein
MGTLPQGDLRGGVAAGRQDVGAQGGRAGAVARLGVRPEPGVVDQLGYCVDGVRGQVALDLDDVGPAAVADAIAARVEGWE